MGDEMTTQVLEDVSAQEFFKDDYQIFPEEMDIGKIEVESEHTFYTMQVKGKVPDRKDGSTVLIFGDFETFEQFAESITRSVARFKKQNESTTGNNPN